MTTASKKEVNERLRALRAERKAWETCNGLHFDFTLRCPATRPEEPGDCEGPTCEGCMATAERRWHIKRLDAEIRRLLGKPEPAPKTRKTRAAKPAAIQLPLFT